MHLNWIVNRVVLISETSLYLENEKKIDFYGEIGDADARSGRASERDEAASVPTVSQIVFVQSSAGAAHPRAHGRKALPVLLLRPTLQTAQPRSAAHSPPHR